MTEPLFYQDSYQTELVTKVTRVEGDFLEFEQSIFYPLGGGQPGDTGKLSHQSGEYEILDTRKGEALGSIKHQINTSEHDIEVGDEVSLSLNWQRRHAHMRMHTCMHLLGSLIPVPVTGGSVGALKSRLDFDVGENKLDKQDLTVRLNQLIEQNSEVLFESITDAELDANPELVRTMSVQPPRGAGTIRMVRVKDVDYQPCGGTHVNRVGEIGPVRISKIENKGKRNRRVNIVFDAD